MNEPACDHPCELAAVCREQSRCVLAAQPVSLPEALGQWEREAERGVLDTGRYRCAYFSWGEGPPLVFVHGVADNARSFVLTMSLLARRFRCIGYDLPTGEGDGADLPRYRHDDLVADLLALVNHLGLRRAYLCGASLGSTVALAALHAEPERFLRAALLTAFAHRPLGWWENLIARIGCRAPGIQARVPFWDAGMRRTHYAPFASRAPEVWEFFRSQIGRVANSTVALHALLLNQIDLRPKLAGIRQPVLLIGGDQDPVVLGRHEEELLHGLPNARRVGLIGCGHIPFLTHPELLAEIVGDFLTPPRPVDPSGGAAACSSKGP